MSRPADDVDPDPRQHLPRRGAERAARHGGGLRRHRHAEERGALPRRRAVRRRGHRRARAERPRSSRSCKAKQTIVCQVTKNPIGAKGARLTQEVSLPGRFVVLIPNSSTYGISKRLPDDERKRLRAILDRVKPDAARRDRAHRGRGRHRRGDRARRAPARWTSGTQIEALAKRSQAPALLYREPDMAVRVIREEFNDDYRGVVIDDRALYERCATTSSSISPALADRVEFYDRDGGAAAAVRALPRARAAPQGARPQGVAAVGRLAHHRAHRGAHGHRREHRQERRHVEPRGDGVPQQPRGRRRDRPPAPAARHRRHHRHRLHRHGDPGQPRRGRSRSSATPWPGTRPAPRCSTSPSSASSR